MFVIQLILMLGLVSSVIATTRHVPVDYPTIQAALDTLSAGDTVLIDVGVYEEALVAPALPFVLRGNVTPDTGDYPRPVVDPSALSNPTGRTCLRQDSSSVVIEDMVFRNRLPMYPHTWDTTGGIHHPYGTLTLRRCVFDSTFNAMRVYYADVIVSQCDFRNISGACIRTTRSVIATDCNFHSNMVAWAQVSSWGNSLIERCHFWGDYGNQSVLNMSGVNTQVRDCVFGPGVAESGERFYFSAGSSVFENNVIEDWSLWQGIWNSDVNEDGPLYIRHNVVRNCLVPLAHPEMGLTGFQLDMLHSCDSCFIAFDSNEVTDCFGNWGAPGVFAWAGNVVARFNRFARLFPKAVWSRDSAFVLRDNLIYENGTGLESDSGVMTDARWNWWGDASGPYHSTLNPNGQGDEIRGDHMIFAPWYSDTSFFTNSAPPTGRTALPEAYSLSVYPNPFNPSARLQFTMKKAGRVEIKVYNLAGQRVRTLCDAKFEAGYHTVAFDASDLPTGIYFAKLVAGDFVKTEKLVLMK